MFTTALLCMSLAIFHEARGEPDISQIGVGYTIINRVEDKEHPDSVCEVVYESGEFSGIKRDKKYKKQKEEWEDSKRIANLVLLKMVKNPIGSRKYFNHKRLGKRYKTPYPKVTLNKMVYY